MKSSPLVSRLQRAKIKNKLLLEHYSVWENCRLKSQKGFEDPSATISCICFSYIQILLMKSARDKCYTSTELQNVKIYSTPLPPHVCTIPKKNGQWIILYVADGLNSWKIFLGIHLVSNVFHEISHFRCSKCKEKSWIDKGSNELPAGRRLNSLQM